MSKILFIGKSGFVGAKVLEGFSSFTQKIISPSSVDLDITKKDSVRRYVEVADIVINFAAFTDVKRATLDLNGPAWKLNVEGSGNIAKICKEMDKFLIHISTDAVFPCLDTFKGPYDESEIILDDSKIVSPYGYTKLRGEMEVNRSEAKAAILRIAYPFGNSNYPDKDYIVKLIRSAKSGYPLFADQQFTPTYIKSLTKVIEKLSTLKLTGVFHWVCRELTTPYSVGLYTNERLGLGLKIKKGSLANFEKTNNKQSYAKFGGLTTRSTEKRLGLKPPSWREAIEDFSSELKVIL